MKSKEVIKEVETTLQKMGKTKEAIGMDSKTLVVC